MSAVRADDQDHRHLVRRACDVVSRALGEAARRPEATSFFNEPTNTASATTHGNPAGLITAAAAGIAITPIRGSARSSKSTSLPKGGRQRCRS